MSSLEELKTDLLDRADYFREVGLNVEDAEKIWPLVDARVKARYGSDLSYHREEGDNASPSEVPSLLAKDYAIEALNTVFGEKRYALGEKTRAALLEFAVALATKAIGEDVARVAAL